MTIIVVDMIQGHIMSMESDEEFLRGLIDEEGITKAERQRRTRMYLRAHIAREHVQLGLNILRKGLQIAEEPLSDS